MCGCHLPSQASCTPGVVEATKAKEEEEEEEREAAAAVASVTPPPLTRQRQHLQQGVSVQLVLVPVVRGLRTKTRSMSRAVLGQRLYQAGRRTPQHTLRVWRTTSFRQYASQRVTNVKRVLLG